MESNTLDYMIGHKLPLDLLAGNLSVAETAERCLTVPHQASEAASDAEHWMVRSGPSSASIGGDCDAAVGTAESAGWEALTTAGFVQHVVPGGHGAVATSAAAVVDVVAELVKEGKRVP